MLSKQKQRAIKQQVLAKDSDLIGNFVWWNLHTMPTPVTFTEIERFAAGNGTTDLMAAYNTMERSFLKVCGAGLRGDDAEQHAIKPAGKNSDRAVFSLVCLNRDKKEQRLHPVEVSRLIFTRTMSGKPGVGRLELDRKHPIAEKIRAEVERMVGNCDITDVRWYVKKMLMEKMDGVPLKDSGGVFFIPSTKDQELADLKDAAKEWGCQLVVAPQHKDSLHAAQDAATNHFWAEVQRMQDELGALINSEHKVRDSTFSKKLDEVARVKNKASFYRMSLGLVLTDFDKSISALEQQIHKLIGA